MTALAPLATYVTPTDRVGVARVGRLGNMASTRRGLQVARLNERRGCGSCTQPDPGVTAAVPMITKGGLETITQDLAMEYTKDGIRVNAVAPGAVYTLHRDAPKNVMESLSPMERPSKETTRMVTVDTFRYTKIPLTHGSGAIPALGFGTLIPDLLATKHATKTALEVGFRHFDCAERYRNEQAVGDAMQEVFRAGTLRREDVFLTTKLWNNNHRPERVKPAFEASCQRLQLDYVDCYLIHTPFAFQPGNEQDPRDERGQVLYDPGVTLVETWRALEHLVDEGRCKSIGLSDVSLENVKEIIAAARIKPAVVQVESHPYLPRWDMLEFCSQHRIVLLAFAALAHGMEPNLLDDPVITAIAHRVRKTPAQVALAWAIQRGTALLTTSTTPRRIQENFDISILPEDAMQEIRNGITRRVQFNAVVETGVPGFIPQGR